MSPPKPVRTQMFNFNDPPEVHFEINDRLAHGIKQPTPASKARPSWWKQIQPYHPDVKHDRFVEAGSGTIRTCPAITDIQDFGYMMYLPFDIYVNATDKDHLKVEIPPRLLDNGDGSKYVSSHFAWQVDGLKIGEEFHPQHLKINPVFGVSTSKGYSAWMTHPVNRTDLPFRTMDSLVDTDTYTAFWTVIIFIKIGFKGVIEAGTPMLQVMPFKRDPVFNSTVVPKDENKFSRNWNGIKVKFYRTYKNFFWERKRFN